MRVEASIADASTYVSVKKQPTDIAGAGARLARLRRREAPVACFPVSALLSRVRAAGGRGESAR